jgi:hypothetical protein
MQIQSIPKELVPKEGVNRSDASMGGRCSWPRGNLRDLAYLEPGISLDRLHATREEGGSSLHDKPPIVQI